MAHAFAGRSDNHGPTTPKRTRGGAIARLVAITAALLATTLLATAGVYAATLNHRITRADLLSSSGSGAPVRSVRGALNAVILGTTTPTGQPNQASGNRILVLHLSQDRTNAALINIPRSTYVQIPGHGWGTIGSAYAIGGPQLLDSTVEKMFNTRMDHMAILNMEGFLGVARPVGTITVNNPVAFSDYGFTFAQGTIPLDGPRALAYVKQRPGEVSGGQTARQRLVVEAGVKLELSPRRLRNPIRLNRFIRATTKNLTLDRNLTFSKLVGIATSLRLQNKKVDVIRVPLGPVITVNGQQVRKVSPSAFPPLATALGTDTMDDYVGTHPNIR